MTSAPDPSSVGPRHYQQFIAGEWAGAADGATFEDFSPYDGSVVARVPASTGADAKRAVESAAAAFPAWKATAPGTRQRLLLRAADIVERRKADLMRLMAVETGAVAAFSGFPGQWAAGVLRLAAQWPYEYGGEIIPVDAPDTYVMAVRRPLGVVAGFSPWNGAFNLAWRTIAPPLACGNTVILKPSEEAPVSAGIAVAEILAEAGFPAEGFNVITHAPGAAGPVADEVFASPDVRAISFTGSTAIGRMLAERAGRHLKRIVLELGGFNPLIVLRDANLDDAVETAAFAAFFHQGQICMNSRKIIVERPVFGDFLAAFTAKARIAEAVSQGARVITGGEADGRCFQPTILVDVPPGAALYCEETFGPVVAVEAVDDPQEAVRVANATPYGLTAAILTEDTGTAVQLAGAIEAGVVNINGPTMYAEPILPIGGGKESGWGRFGRWSAENFTDRNLITVHHGKPLRTL